MNCYCDTLKPYNKCCGQYIEGSKKAESPVSLMRSRYSAYTQGLVDYIEKTMCGTASLNFNKLEAQKWAHSVKWLRLQILYISAVEKGIGYVEFLAQYIANGEIVNLHERSRFELMANSWYYTNSQPSKIKLTKKLIEINRNDPCPCRSGKKFKRCCSFQ